MSFDHPMDSAEARLADRQREIDEDFRQRAEEERVIEREGPLVAAFEHGIDLTHHGYEWTRSDVAEMWERQKESGYFPS